MRCVQVCCSLPPCGGPRGPTVAHRRSRFGLTVRGYCSRFGPPIQLAIVAGVRLSDSAWPATGWCGAEAPAFSPADVTSLTHQIRQTTYVVIDPVTGGRGVASEGSLVDASTPGALPLVAMLPPIYPEWLGDRTFGEVHGVRFPYVAGEMANGIATTRLVIEMARSGFLGFFGAAGLARGRVEAAIDELARVLGPECPGWGSNLIHSPNEPALEASVAELYLARGVRKVSASAYMSLTPAVVGYAYSGLRVDASGRVHRANAVFAKVSRPEVARHFMSPAPPAMLDSLVSGGRLSVDEARLGASLPIAEDITVESDSGGHTDNRPLGPLFASIQALRDDLTSKYGYTRPIRLGAAGGIGTPQSVASAFGLGAAYVLTGSVNQSCLEAGLAADAQGDAVPGRPGRRDDGAGRRHVRAGRRAAGAQARHDVRAPGQEAVPALPQPTPRSSRCPLTWSTTSSGVCWGCRSGSAGRRLVSSGWSVIPRRSAGRRRTRATRWR